LVRTIVDRVWPVSTLMLKRVHTPAAERLAKWRMAPPCADDERRTRLAPRRNPTQMEEAVADAASDDAGIRSTRPAATRAWPAHTWRRKAP
jgi:hypothetical protein